MKLFYYIAILLFVFKAYGSAHDNLKELLAILIYAASDDNGDIVKDGANNLKVNVSGQTGRNILLDITSIIPNLRNNKVTFNTLHDLANTIYDTYFPEGNNPDDIIKLYDLVNSLITDENQNEISLFTGTNNKEIYFLSKNNINKDIYNYIQEKNANNLKANDATIIDINNPLNALTLTTSDQGYLSREKLIAAIAAQCIEMVNDCKNKYFYDERDFSSDRYINTYIITTQIDNNIKKHTFIIDDYKSKILSHPFTLIERTDNNNIKTYTKDESLNSKHLTYDQIKTINNVYNKHYTSSNRVQDPGIGIIYHFGTILKTQKGEICNPNIPTDPTYFINDNTLNSKSIKAYIAPNPNQSNPSVIDINDNIVCSKSNSKYKKLESIILEFIRERKNKNLISQEKLEKINNLSKIYSIIKLYPMNTNNKFNGIVNENKHIIEVKNTLSFSQSIQNFVNTGNLCTFNKLRKREDSSCTHTTKLVTEFDISKTLISTLIMFRDKKLNSNILLGEEFSINDADEDNDDNNNKIKNLTPKKMYKNAEKVHDVWNGLMDDYLNNEEEFNEKESEDFINNLNEFINGWKDNVSKHSNSKNEFTENVTEEDINNLKIKMKKIKSIHENHYKPLIDENGDDSVNELEYNSDSQSDLYKNKLIENINNAYSLLNENNEEIHICMLFNFGKDDNKEFDEDRTEEIDLLLEDIDQMNINANDKEEFKNKLLYLYNEFDKLWKVFEEDNTNNDEIKNNSETVLKLRNAFAKKLKKEYFNDNEIQSIQIIDESNIKSSNIINLDHLNVDKSNFIDYISNDINSKSYIKLFFDNMKIKVLMLDENQNELSDGIYKDIKLLETNIMKKIQDMKSYSSAEGHFEEADHLLELISNYNDLISVCIHENKVNDDGVTDIIKAIDIDSDDELKNRLKYIATKKENEGINKIFKENSDKFKNNENKEKFENYINTNGDDAIRFTFGNDSVNKGTLKDFNRLLKSPANSEGEAIVSIMENSSDEYGVSEISDSYKLKLGLIKCASPMSRDPKDIDDIATVSNKLIKISKNWSNIETYQEHNFRTFMNFLTSVNKYDDYAVGNVENVKNNEEGFIDLSSTYNNEENSLEINSYHDIFSNMNDLLLEINEFENSLNNDDKEQVKEQLNEIKSNIDNAMNELYKHIKGSKIKLAESAGRENSEQFNKAINEFNEISNGAKMLFKTHAKLRSDDNSNSSSNFESKLNSLSKISSIKNVNSKLGLKNKNKNKALLMKKAIRKIKRFA